MFLGKEKGEGSKSQISDNPLKIIRRPGLVRHRHIPQQRIERRELVLDLVPRKRVQILQQRRDDFLYTQNSQIAQTKNQ